MPVSSRSPALSDGEVDRYELSRSLKAQLKDNISEKQKETYGCYGALGCRLTCDTASDWRSLAAYVEFGFETEICVALPLICVCQRYKCSNNSLRTTIQNNIVQHQANYNLLLLCTFDIMSKSTCYAKKKKKSIYIIHIGSVCRQRHTINRAKSGKYIGAPPQNNWEQVPSYHEHWHIFLWQL